MSNPERSAVLTGVIAAADAAIMGFIIGSSMVRRRVEANAQRRRGLEATCLR